MKTNAKQTVKRSFSVLLALGLSVTMAAQAGYGEIRGTVKDDMNETVPFATIKILQGTQFIGGTTTDMNGAYVYKPLEAGTYEMILQESSHQTTKINKIVVRPNDAAYVSPIMGVNTLTEVVVSTKLVEKDYTNTGVDQSVFQMKTLSADEILKNASGNRGDIKSLLPSMTPEITEGSNGELHVRGGRSGTSAYFVDGVRVADINMLPGLSIENLTLFTGGVPAAYGDTAGGVVVITTKSYFSGIRDKRMRDARINEHYKEEQKQKVQKNKSLQPETTQELN